MVGIIEPCFNGEDGLSMGRSLAITSSRYHYRKIKRKSIVYDFNRLRRELSHHEIADLEMRTKYSGVVDDLKKAREILIKDVPRITQKRLLEDPLLICARVVLDSGKGFIALGEGVREAIGRGNVELDDFLAYLISHNF